MSAKKNVVFVSTDDGNAGNGGYPVARKLLDAGHQVTYLLDAEGSAALSYQTQGAWLNTLCQGLDVVQPRQLDDAKLQQTNAIVTTLSASGAGSLEQIVTQWGINHIKPVVGIEDVPFGRHNPGWSELAKHLTALITVIPQDDDQTYQVTPDHIVGPLHFKRYQGVDFPSAASQARAKLNLQPGEAVVWVLLHPNAESPAALLDIGQALCQPHFTDKRPTVVVTRHRRELTNPIPGNTGGYQYALRFLASKGFRIIDNSVEYSEDQIPLERVEDKILPDFCPESFPTYTEMLALCGESGVVVTGFATAGLLDAPYLGAPSSSYLNRFTWGGLAIAEKNMIRVPLHHMRQVGNVKELSGYLAALLYNQQQARTIHIATLKQLCPWPEGDPAQKAADIILSLTK